MRKLLLPVDATYIVRRVHKANPAQDPLEKAKGAIETAHYSLRRAMREHKPTHCILAFDAGGPNWRHALYPAYKAERSPIPEELQAELLNYKAHLRSEGWAVAEHPGFEADDTLGSAAFTAGCELGSEVDVVVLATDKDIACLGQYGARVYDHFGKEWHDDAWCRAKTGVGLNRLQDWLALVGDVTDGVPGVDDVGAKTAAKLLLEHGDLAGVLAAADTIKGKVGEKIREQTDRARLSRQLTALRLDLFGSSLDWDALRVPAAYLH
jgi:protein Xni